MCSKKVCCVLVTYNRIQLLKKSIESIVNQTYKLEKIIIVDNASTDGTYEYLTELEKNKQIEYIRLEKNIGGSGGFYKGIQKAISKDIDWIWIMDDDTICRENSLELLINNTDNIKNVGFICSRVLWKDGNVHYMNIPSIKPIIGDKPFNKYMGKYLVESCSFVSVMINKKAVMQVGLPYKEFFIWGDDSEYTKRIIKKGYLGIYCEDSIVEHHTGTNYNTNIMKDDLCNYWKYGFGIRNTLFILKQESLVKYFLKLIHNLMILIPKIILSKKEKKLKLAKIVLKSTIKSIFFNPRIDFIK